MKSLEFWLISSMLSSGLGGGGGVEPLLLGSGFPAHQAVTIEASRVNRAVNKTPLIFTVPRESLVLVERL